MLSMIINKKQTLALSFILSFFLAQSQVSKEVLFVGNSFTFIEDIPNIVSLLASSNGDELIYDASAFGSFSLIDHSSEPSTISKIQSANWDHVVLQDRSLWPAYLPLNFYEGVEKLTQLISENSPCLNKTILYMTWGLQNSSNFPYNEMQELTINSYNSLATVFGTEVSPVGVAWKKIRDGGDLINLYHDDGSHQNFAGAYLSACVFYAAIFNKSPVGIAYKGSLSQMSATHLQEKANEAYNEYVNLGYLHTSSSSDLVTDVYRAKINNTEAELNNLVSDCCLNTSYNFRYTGFTNQTEVNTTLQYKIYQNSTEVENKTLSVSMSVAANVCVNKEETFPLNIDLSNVGIGEFTLDIFLNGQKTETFTLQKTVLSISNLGFSEKIYVFPNPVKNSLLIDVQTAESKLKATIYNTYGKKIHETEVEKKVNFQLDVSNLISGIYILKLEFDKNTFFKKIIKN